VSDRVDAIAQKLYREDAAGIFAVLDGASVPGLRQRLADEEPEHVCLYAGELEPDMEEVAPYLVKLVNGDAFTNWVLDRGWGNHWGIFAESSSELPAMRRHFRSLLTVHDPNGKPMLFRYYDPRVLRVFLPTCTSTELNAMFGPVQSYSMEDESGAAMLRFRMKNGSLAKQVEQL
jgi:hypothetical protein